MEWENTDEFEGSLANDRIMAMRMHMRSAMLHGLPGVAAQAARNNPGLLRGGNQPRDLRFRHRVINSLEVGGLPLLPQGHIAGMWYIRSPTTFSIPGLNRARPYEGNNHAVVNLGLQFWTEDGLRGSDQCHSLGGGNGPWLRRIDEHLQRVNRSLRVPPPVDQREGGGDSCAQGDGHRPPLPHESSPTSTHAGRPSVGDDPQQLPLSKGMVGRDRREVDENRGPGYYRNRQPTCSITDYLHPCPSGGSRRRHPSRPRAQC